MGNEINQFLCPFRTQVHTCNIPYNRAKLIKVSCCLVEVIVHILIFFFPYNFTIESISRVNFRLSLKIDVLVVYKVSLSFQRVGQLTALNSIYDTCCTELPTWRFLSLQVIDVGCSFIHSTVSALTIYTFTNHFQSAHTSQTSFLKSMVTVLTCLIGYAVWLCGLTACWSVT